MGNKLGPIVFMNGTVKKEEYITILEQNLLQFIDALRVDGLRYCISTG